MNDPELDDRIRRSLHVEPAADQLARLERYWRRQSSVHGARFWRWAVAAASLAALGLGAWWATHLPIEQPQQRVAIENLRASEPSVHKSPAPVHEPPPVVHPLQIAAAGSREATDYEQLLFSIQTGRNIEPPPARDHAAIIEVVKSIDSRDGIAGLAATARDASDVDLRSAACDRLLQHDDEASLRAFLALVADERTRGEALAAIVRAKHQPIDDLLNLLADDQRPVRLAAALVLGRINTPEVAEKLIVLVTGPESSSEAWMALLACRGESADRFLAAASQHPRLLGHLNYARLQWTQLTP